MGREQKSREYPELGTHGKLLAPAGINGQCAKNK